MNDENINPLLIPFCSSFTDELCNHIEDNQLKKSINNNTMEKLLECFNTEIFSISINVGSFEKATGDVKEFEFKFHNPYSDTKHLQPVPEIEFKKFLQDVLVKMYFEKHKIKDNG